MSDSDPRILREELEIRVVALLTGELSEVDADELEQILTVDAELSAFRDRMAVLIGHVHDARDEIAPPVATEGLRLSPERRAEIFKDVDAAEFEPREEPRRISWKMRVFEIAAVFAVLFILAAILIPTVGSVRKSTYSLVDQEEAYFEEPAIVVVSEMGPPASQSYSRSAESFALQTEIPAEMIEGTPHPIRLSKRAPVAKAKNSGDYRVEMEELPSQKLGMKRPQRSLSVPKPDTVQSARGVEVAELEMANSFEMNAGHGFGGGLGQLGGSLRDGAEVNSSSLSSLDARESKGDKVESDASWVAYGYAQSDAFKKEKPRKDSEVPVFRSEFVGSDASSMDGEDALMTMDAFDAPSSGGYAGERSKSNVDPFAGPAVASKKPVDLLTRGRAQYLNGDYDGASATFAAIQHQDPANAEARLFQNRIGKIKAEGVTGKTKTREQMLTEVSQSWNRPKVFDVDRDDVGVASASILHKPKSIVIPQVNFSGVPLSEVLETLSELSVEYDPEHVGINMVPLYDPKLGDPRVNISLRNLNVDRILEFVTQQVNYRYEVREDVVVVEPVIVAAPPEPKATLTPKAEKQTTNAPISTFSLNVSDVSFKLAQAALESSRVPDAMLIRSEEFVNSFDYRDPVPQADEAVSLNWEIADLPYAHGRQVIRFSLQTQAAGRMATQPLNLHLLVDNSGSMQRPDRRAILEQSLQSLKDKLQPQDELSIVLFARQPQLIANASTHESQQVAVDQALAYRPEGGTNLEAGLSAAYENAQRNFDPAASNRVILMTDGAANLGDVDGSALADMVVEQRKQGIALDAFGIGWDDYNDALLEEITRNGDGRYGFLNSAEDAAQDFSEKLAGSLRVAAADVKVQVIWNPERVTTYRQVGYDLHQLKTEDFRDNTVDAAEIGEAEAGTALYVVQINDDPDVVGGLGALQVRYRDPATGLYHEQKWPLEMPRAIPSLEVASPALRLATTSALFAERLAHNPYARGYSFSELSSLTNDLPEAFPTQQRVVDLQNMINNARMLLGDAN